MTGFRLILMILIIMMIPLMKIYAGYTFLGNIARFERTEEGINLYCEGDLQLQIRFLKPSMFRVILVRPDYQEPLLDYPIAKTQWNRVSLRLKEEDAHLILESTEISLVIQKSPCRLSVLDKQGNVLNRDDPAMGIGWDGKEVRCWKTLAQGERFFGLGEKTGDVNKRGKEWVMWNSDIPGYTNKTDPLYQSIPFYIGLHNDRAYGIYFNNSYRTVFNLGAGNQRYSSFAAEQGNMDYFFILGPQISQVVSAYTELTGRISLPPGWALGYQQCRWSYYPDKEVLNLARTFRQKEIPADVIYLDIHYMDDYRVFTWDKNRFPDPAGMLDSLRSMGFKVVTIIDPGVKADSSYRIAREGLEGDHFIKYPDGDVYIGEVWPGSSFFPDFSRTETRQWWGGHIAEMCEQGVAGFWNDMNEPAVWGKAFPLELLMHDKGRHSSQKKMHNLYGFLMSGAAYEGLLQQRPDERPFLVTRAGFAGEQRFTAVWTGDNVASEDHLELGIRMMLGLSLSGVPFVGMDVGGFIGTPSPELFARWIQVGAFSPFFRTHTEYDSQDQEPWSFGETVEEISRKYISLRYQLLPYFYTLFWEASESGTPVLRPLFWYHQDDPTAYDPEYQHQFFVGENLLVAPVTREKEYLKKVYFPRGKWLDLDKERVFEGPRTVVIRAELDELPMFLRGGGIVPFQEPRQYVEENHSRNLILEVFPETAYGNFLLYEDDGESNDYLKGKYRLTQFEYIVEYDHLNFSKMRVRNQFPIPERIVEVRFHNITEKPAKITLGKEALPEVNGYQKNKEGYYYNNARNVLVIRFRDTGGEQSIEIR